MTTYNETLILKDYTLKEFKELESKMTQIAKFQVFVVNLVGSLTAKKEVNLLNFAKKHKYDSSGKSLELNHSVVLFEVGDNVTVENDEIKEIFKHNEESLKNYNIRKSEVELVNQYSNEMKNNPPELNFEDLQIEDVGVNLTRSFSTLVKDSMNYSEYISEPELFSGMRANLSTEVDFQRPLVWELEMKQRFILSIIKGLPLGVLYINAFNIYSERDYSGKSITELTDIDGIVYDGKQRISTVVDFKLGKFPVVINGHEYFYHNIRPKFERALGRTINVVETQFTDKKDLIKYYLQINENKVEHDSEAIQHAKNIMENLK